MPGLMASHRPANIRATTALWPVKNDPMSATPASTRYAPENR
jgi:hypothetical protein